MRYISKELIEKGFSPDVKYRVSDENGASYLLREAGIENQMQKTEEFHIMQRLEGLGLSMCRPVKLWWDETSVYTLHQWIEGDDLDDVLPRLSLQEQYRLGLEAGRQLRIIHSNSAPEGLENWSELYEEKLVRTLEKYNACPLKHEMEAFFLERAQADRFLVEGRPTMLLHGDFHRANLMVDKRGRLVVIDFQKFGWGDPWAEFDAITWDVQAAPSFARGRVDGYFEGTPPKDFWKLLSAYICRGLLNGLVWAAQRGREQVAIMRQHAAMVRSWYGDGSDIPNWYGAIGLKRGSVHLVSHDPCWMAMAEDCITQLRCLLGAVILDIQHIGSTAISGIRAKPILDIAIAVTSLEEVQRYIPVLEQHNIIYRGQDHPGQLLFVKGDFAQDTRTHHIHVVARGDVAWENYLNFRDYLNACPTKADMYDCLKGTLAEQYGNDRAAYTAGKSRLVSQLLEEARLWRMEMQDGSSYG